MNALNKGLLRLFERYMPDPLVLTALITIFVFLAGMILKAQSPVAMAQSWYGGFFTLHAFAMQIILILVAGYAIARSPAFGRLVDWLARMATTPTRAIVLVTGCTLVVTWLNYGIGLVIGAILARELVQRVKGVDYRVLIAGAYAGFIVWDGGLSGAAPLGVATKGNFLEAKIGGLIPVSQTIFSGVNLSLSVLVSVVLILTLVIVGRNIDDPVGLNSDAPEAESIKATPANRLENSRILGLVIGLLGLATILWYFLHDGGLGHVGRYRAILHSARQSPYAAAADLLVCGSHQSLRAVGRRPMGHSGPDRGGCGQGPWRGACRLCGGLCLGRCLDQPDPAVLGAARAGHRRAQGQGHHGILYDFSGDNRDRDLDHPAYRRHDRLMPGPARKGRPIPKTKEPA